MTFAPGIDYIHGAMCAGTAVVAMIGLAVGYLIGRIR